MEYKYPDKFVYGLWVLNHPYDNPEDRDNYEFYSEYDNLDELQAAIKDYIAIDLFNLDDNIVVDEHSLYLDTSFLNYRNFSYECIKNQFRIQKIYILENGNKITQYELEFQEDNNGIK
ncbi:hypothetical protein ACNQ2K_00255 [Mycoplasma sp. VS292A]|uniref:hypothetical protein n=1 Tax=Mycoplasma sp. VS292A TaxID=3401680 RepID=UPI003AAC64D6